MRKKLNEETKQKLITIYNQVENDFKQFPNIKTTEDFFIFREEIKKLVEKRVKGTDKENNIEYKKALRNKIIEDEIKGNKSLELLYDWSKFYRMISRSKGKLRFINDQYGIEDNDHVIKATSLLHNHLVEQGKANTKDLFDIFQLREINLGVRYTLRTINTPYEFERVIVKEDETESWPAPLFIMLLEAYGVTGEDLLEVGREFETLSNKYLEDIKVSDSIGQDDEKKYTHTIKG